MQRQSSSMRDDAAPQTNQRKSDERFDENELPHSLMPEQFSDAPEIQVSLLDQYREVSQTSSSPRQQQELKLQRENMEERIQNVEVDSTNKENNAVIQYSNEAANPHNNTTGEMHDAMIREQQQNGPIGGRDVVANECFRNSLTYVDRELQSFVYNSNEKEQKNEKIQAEKERERDKSKQKQSRDEEIAFQQMVHAINEYTNILEVMFPNYAREYHEKNSHWQVPLEQSADLHQQSKSTNSPRHNTTNEVVLSLSFDEIDHRFDNFHPANEQTNPDRHAFDEHNLRDFDDFSIILFQDNENEFFNDFNAFEETLKARLMRQAKLNHVTQSYSTEQLGMSSLLLQSQEFTKERSSKQENRIPLQKSIKPNRSQKNLLQLQQPQTNLDKARLLKPVLQVSTDVAPNQLISIPQRIQLGVKQPELPQLRDSSSYVEESTAKDYIETFEDSKIASMVGSDALTNPLNEIKDIEYAKALQTDANQVNELAAQAALDILFAHFNESLSQPMQSEKLEAMFKKMRKKDIIKLRIALSIIHQSLGASPDESGSEVFSPYQFESITKVPGMSSSTLGSLFCRNTRRAVKKFKRNNGLSVDSVVDKETWVKIMQRAKDLLPVRIQEQAAADRGEPKKTQAHQMLPTLQAFCSEFDQHFKPSVKHNLHKRRSLIDFHLKLHKPALDGQEQAKQNPTPKFMQDFPDSQKHIEDITLMRRTSSEGQNQNMPLQTSPMLIGGTALDTNEESKQRPARFILKASSDIFFQQIDASPDQTSPLRFKQVSGRCSQNESDTDNKKKK